MTWLCNMLWYAKAKWSLQTCNESGSRRIMCNYKSGLKKQSLSQQCSLCFWTPQPNLIKFPLTPLNANIATLHFLVSLINQFLDRSQWQQESYHNTQTTNTQRWSKTRWDLIAAVCSLSNPGFPQIWCAQKTQMQGSRGNPDPDTEIT